MAMNTAKKIEAAFEGYPDAPDLSKTNLSDEKKEIVTMMFEQLRDRQISEELVNILESYLGQ